MQQVYSQAALISAVFGGFAFAFLGALLTIESSKRVYSWSIGVAAFASVCFIVSALGATFSAAWVNVAEDALMFERIEAIQGTINLWFFFGLLMLLSSIGLTGWIRSRLVGIVTTSVAIVGVISVAHMVSAFLF